MTKTDMIQLLIDFFREVNCSFKVKLVNRPLTSNWNKMFIRPVQSYVEFGHSGPVKISELEWIDINPVEQIYIGRLVPDKFINHSQGVKDFFDKNAVKYSINDEIIRVIIAGV